MYGRLYLFPFGARDRAKLEAAVDRVTPQLAAFPGLHEMVFFMDEASGVCGTFSQWDTPEAAARSTAELSDELTTLVGEVAAGAEVQQRLLMLPARLTFELYEPKTRSA